MGPIFQTAELRERRQRRREQRRAPLRKVRIENAPTETQYKDKEVVHAPFGVGDRGKKVFSLFI